MVAKKRIYRVAFRNEGEVYEVFCGTVHQSAMFGFIEIAGLLFGERAGIVVDPAEERLKTVFAGVERTYVPLHAVIRIDEVEKRGTASIHAITDKGKASTAPSPIYTPTKRR